MKMIPPFDAEHAKSCEKAAALTRNKIMRAYHIAPEESMPCPSMGASLAQSIETFLASSAWQKRCSECADFSGFELDKEKQISCDKVARQIMHEYAKAFYLRSVAYEKRPSALAPFHETESSRAILDILINYVTQESLAKVKSLGFDDKNALSLTGFLIHNAVLTYYHVKPEKRIGVRPDMKGSSGSDEELASKLETIANYWLQQRNYLSERYKRMNADTVKSI